MRPLTNLLRVAVLTACAMWLMTRTSKVHAQSDCQKFDTSTEFICSSCCTSNPADRDWTDGYSNGAGIQSLVQMYANCGNPTNSCPGGGTQSSICNPNQNPWFQAQTDSNCCSPSGFACNQG